MTGGGCKQQAVARIRRRLAEMYSLHRVDAWLDMANPLPAARRRARDLIRDGRWAEVERAIDQLDGGECR